MSDILPDSDLLPKIKDGNKKAWEMLVTKYYNPLLNFILSMIRSEATAEELLQDVFVNIWIKKDSLDIKTSLKAYLYRASRNHTLNHIKRKQLEANYQDSLSNSFQYHNNSTEEDYNLNELESKLYRSIESLPENCREVFKMSRFDGLSYKEIAEALDVSTRNVHYQMSIALKALKEDLKDFIEPAEA